MLVIILSSKLARESICSFNGVSLELNDGETIFGTEFEDGLLVAFWPSESRASQSDVPVGCTLTKALFSEVPIVDGLSCSACLSSLDKPDSSVPPTALNIELRKDDAGGCV